MTNDLPTDAMIEAGERLLQIAANGRPGLIADEIKAWKNAVAVVQQATRTDTVSQLVEALEAAQVALRNCVPAFPGVERKVSAALLSQHKDISNAG